MHDGKYMIVHLPWMQEIGKFDRLWEHVIIKIRKQLKCRSYFVVALMMASRLRIHSKVFHHTKSDSSATPILQNHIYYCHKNQYSLTSLFEGSLSILPTWYLQHSHSFDGVLLGSIFFSSRQRWVLPVPVLHIIWTMIVWGNIFHVMIENSDFFYIQKYLRWW